MLKDQGTSTCALGWLATSIIRFTDVQPTYSKQLSNHRQSAVHCSLSTGEEEHGNTRPQQRQASGRHGQWDRSPPCAQITYYAADHSAVHMAVANSVCAVNALRIISLSEILYNFFFFHGVTARGGPKPPSFWDFIPKVFLVGKCAFCSE